MKMRQGGEREGVGGGYGGSEKHYNKVSKIATDF